MKKIFLTCLLGVLLGMSPIFIFQKTALAQNICGEQLIIDLFSCSWWAVLGPQGGCETYLMDDDNDEECSPTGDDCKTDRAICADVSPKICTLSRDIIRSCTTTVYWFCQSPFEQDDCRNGDAYECLETT